MALEPGQRRLIPTCVGCGAMAVLGSCERGCREERLDLVGADAFDELTAALATSQAAVAVFHPVAEQLARPEAEGELWEAEYRRLQIEACDALKAHPERGREPGGDEEDARTATAWWCPDCSGLQAPQPCLSICLWRPVEWVSRHLWEEQREHSRRAAAAEVELRRLLRTAASVTPRAGQWEAGWQVLSAAARRVLEVVDGADPPTA